MLYIKKKISHVLHCSVFVTDSGPRKTGVMVEFSDFAFHLRSPGDLTDTEIDEVVDFLNERVQTQEKTELFQLRNFFDTLHGWVS